MSHNLFLFLLLWTSVGFAGPVPAPMGDGLLHEPDAATRQRMQRHNALQDPSVADAPEPVARPYAEYETARFVIMSGHDSFESAQVKIAIAQNLPDGVDLVFLSNNGVPSESAIRAFFAPYLSADRVHVIQVNAGGTGFWARDGVPVPVFSPNQQLSVVDAKYYHNYEPDSFVAHAFNVPLLSHTYYYEGGNFTSDSRGNCLLIDRNIPDVIFQRYYGCKTVTRLPHLGGIGHVDERIKIISDTVALTDRREYVDVLETLGYQVTLLPSPSGPYETYANSLLVNGTLFVPVFQSATDATALTRYEQFGLKVVPVPSKRLSNYGHGSVHCITMTYPEASLEQLRTFLAD